MINRQIHNEKGITLVELLAAISLFAVLITLSSTLIFQLMGNETKTNEQITLSQNTNLLINEIRNKYYNGDSRICFNNLVREITISELEVDNGNINNGCIEGIQEKEPIFIRLTTTDNTGESLTVETTFNNKEDYVRNLQTKDEGDLDNKEDFEDIIKDDPHNFTNGNTNNSCHFNGNTRFQQRQIGSWNACNNPTVNEGNAWFPNQISIHNNINLAVDHNFFSDETFNLESNAKLNIKNNARLEGPSTLKSDSTFEVNNLYVVNTLTLDSNSSLHAFGGARINDSLMVRSNSNILIDGHFFALGNTTFQENTQINIGENATFENYVNLMGNATLTIGGDAYFHDGVDLQNQNKIIVKGDAHFVGVVGYDWSNGEICVQGDATFDATVGDSLRIKENANSCS
ncbi:type II secretion system protein [Oceanobacillus halotolerans]|uniref:type II secretion system protein n=1 Tax=Oceanobacillus halotolerans TaxID=2663380 RepID=UPI0013DC000D|nr:type II secretion system protein [Oceanobacillus halotolerans]